MKVPRMEPCSWCGGYGMRAGVESVFECMECGGGGMVEARDEQGRFLPWEDLGEVDEGELAEPA